MHNRGSLDAKIVAAHYVAVVVVELPQAPEHDPQKR